MGVNSEEKDQDMFDAGVEARRSGFSKAGNPLFGRLAEKWAEGWSWSHQNEDHSAQEEPFQALYGLRSKVTGRLLSMGVRTYEDPELRSPAKDLNVYDSLYGQFVLVTADKSMLEAMLKGEQPYCGAIFDKVGLGGIDPEEIEIVALTVVEGIANAS